MSTLKNNECAIARAVAECAQPLGFACSANRIEAFVKALRQSVEYELSMDAEMKSHPDYMSLGFTHRMLMELSLRDGVAAISGLVTISFVRSGFPLSLGEALHADTRLQDRLKEHFDHCTRYAPERVSGFGHETRSHYVAKLLHTMRPEERRPQVVSS